MFACFSSFSPSPPPPPPPLLTSTNFSYPFRIADVDHSLDLAPPGCNCGSLLVGEDNTYTNNSFLIYIYKISEIMSMILEKHNSKVAQTHEQPWQTQRVVYKIPCQDSRSTSAGHQKLLINNYCTQHSYK